MSGIVEFTPFIWALPVAVAMMTYDNKNTKNTPANEELRRILHIEDALSRGDAQDELSAARRPRREAEPSEESVEVSIDDHVVRP
jgi:hypothetical protein